MWAPSQVVPGAQCGCVCPGCGAPLVAKAVLSRRRRAHFAHFSGVNCEAGRETAIHRMAKQVLCEASQILLPDWNGAGEIENPPLCRDTRGQIHEGRRVYIPARTVRPRAAAAEYRCQDYVPDVRIEDEEGELLIEVRYRHPVDAEKLARVRADGCRMIEIDLSGLVDSALHDMEQFRSAVLETPSNRVWLSFPGAFDRWREAKRELEAMVAQRNAELAAQWNALQEAARRRQAEKAVDERDKEGRRAFMRQRIREAHAKDLALLFELTDPGRVEARLQECQREAEARVSDLLALVEPAIRSACLRAHPDAWVFGVDPALWQLLVYRQFVAGKPLGSRFNQKDVATWVRRSFPTIQPLYRLFVEQYRSLKNAQRAGFNKRRLTCWAFTQEENERVPHFYAPINDLMGRLEYCQVIRGLPAPLGEYEVCGRPAHGLLPAAGLSPETKVSYI